MCSWLDDFLRIEAVFNACWTSEIVYFMYRISLGKIGGVRNGFSRFKMAFRGSA